jgi:hypothetical protein
MKYLRLLAVFVVVIVFIVPMHVLVTLSTNEDEYLKFKRDTQDRMLETLRDWVHGRQPKKAFTTAGTFNA